MVLIELHIEMLAKAVFLFNIAVSINTFSGVFRLD